MERKEKRKKEKRKKNSIELCRGRWIRSVRCWRAFPMSALRAVRSACRRTAHQQASAGPTTLLKNRPLILHICPGRR